MADFRVHSDFSPAGDQPAAIAALVEGVGRGDPFQTLLGITGSGKSATMAWAIEGFQRPALVIAPNKALAAQLASEFRQFFPENRVEYFVSYYDYYQPEAYIPQTDTYIEKDSAGYGLANRNSAVPFQCRQRRHPICVHQWKHLYLRWTVLHGGYDQDIPTRPSSASNPRP